MAAVNPSCKCCAFQVDPCEFQGSWPAHFVPTPTNLPHLQEEFSASPGIPEKHDPTRCLACMPKVARAVNKREGSEETEMNREVVLPAQKTAGKKDSVKIRQGLSRSIPSSSEDNLTPPNSSASSAKKMDDSSLAGLELIRKEVLQLVLSLSSAVASKSHQERLQT